MGLNIARIDNYLDKDQELEIEVNVNDEWGSTVFAWLTYSDYLKIKAAFEEHKTLDIP